MVAMASAWFTSQCGSSVLLGVHCQKVVLKIPIDVIYRKDFGFHNVRFQRIDFRMAYK